MPRRMTDFNTGTRARYDYQFAGYQGSGARNVFAQLAQVFNTGTAAEQSASLQARHALLMGAVNNSNELARQQGLSDIEFSDYQRRGEHGTALMNEQQQYLDREHPQLGQAVKGLDKSGVPIQDPVVSLSLQQGPAHAWYDKFKPEPKPTGSPFRTVQGSKYDLGSKQFTPPKAWGDLKDTYLAAHRATGGTDDNLPPWLREPEPEHEDHEDHEGTASAETTPPKPPTPPGPPETPKPPAHADSLGGRGDAPEAPAGPIDPVLQKGEDSDPPKVVTATDTHDAGSISNDDTDEPEKS
jgi:hypothetical protein